MQAVVVTQFGPPDVLKIIEVPRPGPGQDEVRIRVQAAPVNPTDLQARAGEMVRWGAAVHRPQLGLGVDVAGVVDAVGPQARRFAVGQPVIGLRERLDQPLGCYAEYVVLEERDVAPAPDGVSPLHASTLPLNVTTADQALSVLRLRAGQWLLVTGAAGALGTFALELAVLRGQRVVVSASGADAAFLRGRGAEHVLDARDGCLAERVRAVVPGGVDGVLDAANLGVRALDAVRADGAFVSVLNSAPQARRGIRAQNLAYHSDGQRLAELSMLAAGGVFSLRVADTVALADVASAHRRLERGGVRGRLVLVPNQDRDSSS